MERGPRELHSGTNEAKPQQVPLADDAFSRDLAELLDSQSERPVAAAYLFGSFARGTSGPASDVDLGILFESDPPRSLDAYPFELQEALARQMGRRVDLVVLNLAPSDLVHRVLRDGVLILERNHSRRVAFEVRKRNEFFDLLPYLRRYREAALRMIKAGA
jgi:predicted nucleotidyltransferase